jgi:beta-galactosidase
MFKRLFFLIIILQLVNSLPNWSFAMTSSNDWENPQVIAQNKEAPHATLMPYATEAQALRAERFQSPFFKSLNGEWKFHWSPKPADRPADFYKPDFDVSS